MYLHIIYKFINLFKSLHLPTRRTCALKNNLARVEKEKNEATRKKRNEKIHAVALSSFAITCLLLMRHLEDEWPNAETFSSLEPEFHGLVFPCKSLRIFARDSPIRTAKITNSEDTL